MLFLGLDFHSLRCKQNYLELYHALDNLNLNNRLLGLFFHLTSSVLICSVWSAGVSSFKKNYSPLFVNGCPDLFRCVSVFILLDESKSLLILDHFSKSLNFHIFCFCGPTGTSDNESLMVPFKGSWLEYKLFFLCFEKKIRRKKKQTTWYVVTHEKWFQLLVFKLSDFIDWVMEFSLISSCDEWLLWVWWEKPTFGVG